MAGRALRRALRLALLAAGLGLGGALALEDGRLLRELDVNRQLAALGADAATPAATLGDDPRLWVATARATAAAGQTVEAAALLRRAADTATGPLREQALYNLGNVYLRAALRMRASGAGASALPLFELAKESYRSALMAQPGLWDAKFNLELALRAAPDADPDDTGAPPVLTGERAVTTMRAFTLGLP